MAPLARSEEDQSETRERPTTETPCAQQAQSPLVHPQVLEEVEVEVLARVDHQYVAKNGLEGESAGKENDGERERENGRSSSSLRCLKGRKERQRGIVGGDSTERIRGESSQEKPVLSPEVVELLHGSASRCFGLESGRR